MFMKHMLTHELVLSLKTTIDRIVDGCRKFIRKVVSRQNNHELEVHLSEFDIINI